MSEKVKKTVFVIMPFVKSPTRDQEALTSFFEDNLKAPIENGNFKYQYIVKRSDDTFNIGDQIIKDIYDADIVICDLSGNTSNPNVMYELGMRFSLTQNPVILIRENHVDNKQIFDVSGFYTHGYNPLKYKALVEHIKTKIKKIESGDEIYKSPVLKILQQDNPLLMEISMRRVTQKLGYMRAGVEALTHMFIDSLEQHFAYKGSELKLPTESIEILPYLVENEKVFMNIDCTDFQYSFNPQPMIDSYLADQYLDNMADRTITKNHTIYTLHYHARYLGSYSQHEIWDQKFIISFIRDSIRLMELISIVGASLSTSGESLDTLKLYQKECINNADFQELTP